MFVLSVVAVSENGVPSVGCSPNLVHSEIPPLLNLPSTDFAVIVVCLTDAVESMGAIKGSCAISVDIIARVNKLPVPTLAIDVDIPVLLLTFTLLVVALSLAVDIIFLGTLVFVLTSLVSSSCIGHSLVAPLISLDINCVVLASGPVDVDVVDFEGVVMVISGNTLHSGLGTKSSSSSVYFGSGCESLVAAVGIVKELMY